MARKLHKRQVRVQVLIEAGEREAFRRAAEEAGKSLSGWIRDSALEKLDAVENASHFKSAAELEKFFKACRSRENEREPDWREHLRVMRESRERGFSRT